MNRVNEQITEKSVTLIDEEGNNLGAHNTVDAIKLARSRSLDLVEVGRGVCKILNFQKYLYQQQKTKKTKHAPDQKEFRFGINIEDHDLQTKARHINELLKKGHPIKVVVRFYGRENAHPEFGHELIERLKLLLEDYVMDKPRHEEKQLIANIHKQSK